MSDDEEGLQATSPYNQLKILLKRGYIKTIRDKVCLNYQDLKVLFDY